MQCTARDTQLFMFKRSSTAEDTFFMDGSWQVLIISSIIDVHQCCPLLMYMEGVGGGGEGEGRGGEGRVSGK